MFSKIIKRLKNDKSDWTAEQWQAELMKHATTPSEQTEITAIFSRHN